MVDVLTTDFNADYCRIQQLTTGDFAVFDNENTQYVATCPDYLTLVNWLKKPIPPLFETAKRAIHEYIKSCG